MKTTNQNEGALEIHTLQELIDESLTNRQVDRKGSGKWKPSMFGRCFRSHYWARIGEPQTNPPDARTIRVFQVGKLFHDFVQEFIPKEDVEVKIETDNVLGFADIVTKDRVIDLKSQHSGAFHYMRNTTNISFDKYPNWLQVMWYAKELKKEKGTLCYISKDDLCIQEYTQYVKDWVDDVECELNTLEWIWHEGILPKARPRAYIKKDKNGDLKLDKEGNMIYGECEYCSYKDKCKEVESERQSNT